MRRRGWHLHLKIGRRPLLPPSLLRIPLSGSSRGPWALAGARDRPRSPLNGARWPCESATSGMEHQAAVYRLGRATRQKFPASEPIHSARSLPHPPHDGPCPVPGRRCWCAVHGDGDGCSDGRRNEKAKRCLTELGTRSKTRVRVVPPCHGRGAKGPPAVPLHSETMVCGTAPPGPIFCLTAWTRRGDAHGGSRTRGL